jgi:surface antigen
MAVPKFSGHSLAILPPVLHSETYREAMSWGLLMRSWRKMIGGCALGLGVLSLSALLVSSPAFASIDTKDSKASTEKAHVVAKPIPTHVNAIVRHASTVPEKHVSALPEKHAELEKKNEPFKKAEINKPQIKGQKVSYVPRLQCVTFARAASGIELKGNAANWWDNASGVYARGQAPESGSVLNFRSTRGMRLGHVAVVTAVVSDREIEIDHANWAGPGASKGGVSRGMSVIDVSPDNSWTQVRVSLGGNGNYGSVYPTYGFIYDRPDNGTFALNTHSAPDAPLDEVAEAPSHSLH